MISIKLHTRDIPDLYGQFSRVVRDSHWKRCIAQLKSEIKGNRFLSGYLEEETLLHTSLNICAS